MTSQSFFSPEISKLLQKKGCEPQLEFWWVFPESKNRPLLMYGQWEAAYSLSNHGYYHKAFHISDIICNKQNAILVFGEKEHDPSDKDNDGFWICIYCKAIEGSNYDSDYCREYHIHHLLDLYNSGENWEEYVKGFLTKDV